MKRNIHLFGDDLDSSRIIPGKYMMQFLSEEELGTHVFENIDPSLAARVKKGDVAVAGKNFGWGASKEEAVQALVGGGFYAVVADSFGRTFFRNCINRGTIVIVECPGIREAAEGAEWIDIDLEGGRIVLSNGKMFEVQPQPEFVQQIIRDHGLLEHIAKMKEGGKSGCMQ